MKIFPEKDKDGNLKNAFSDDEINESTTVVAVAFSFLSVVFRTSINQKPIRKSIKIQYRSQFYPNNHLRLYLHLEHILPNNST